MANMNVTTINTLDLMEALHQAASSLDQAIQMDENYLDLSVLLQVQQYGRLFYNCRYVCVNGSSFWIVDKLTEPALQGSAFLSDRFGWYPLS